MLNQAGLAVGSPQRLSLIERDKASISDSLRLRMLAFYAEKYEKRPSPWAHREASDE